MNESFQNNRKIRTQITDEILLEKIWLAFGYGNITFEDSLDFDISEIESIYEHQEDNENYSVETL